MFSRAMKIIGFTAFGLTTAFIIGIMIDNPSLLPILIISGASGGFALGIANEIKHINCFSQQQAIVPVRNMTTTVPSDPLNQTIQIRSSYGTTLLPSLNVSSVSSTDSISTQPSTPSQSLTVAVEIFDTPKNADLSSYISVSPLTPGKSL